MFDVWKNVLAEVEQKIPDAQFATWFKDTTLMNFENGVATVGVRNLFAIKQITNRYTKILIEALKRNKLAATQIKCVVRSDVKPKVQAREVTSSPVLTPVQVARTSERLRGSTLSTGLDPRYTMEKFVVGSNNDLAVSVARNIIENPGQAFNPFFLYGGSGLGKTHLVQAIGHELVKRNPNLKILYTPVSGFYSEFIKYLQNQKVEEFRQKMQQLDVLIIDDFQMIMNKDASQVEFFDLFNYLFRFNKQIMVTSDRLPSEIKTVDVRLASRLAGAGAFDLQMPQFEDRCAILRSKADFEGKEIEDAAIEYLAENVRTNIRDLEGSYKHLMAVAELKNMSPMEVISEGFAGMATQQRNTAVSPRSVVEKVAKYYDLSVKEMCGKSRVANIKNARQVAMYILSKELQMSTTKIALEVGVKDHTTVMHGVKKIDNDLKLNFALRDQLAAIRENIYA